MKKIVLLSLFILLGQSILYSRSLNDSSSVEKTGWLVYYLGHVIWFESTITNDIKDKSFFNIGKKYENGQVVDDMNSARFFKLFSKCYRIKSLTNIDTSTKKGEYTFKESLCIIPVKAMVKTQTDSRQFNFTGMSFKKNNAESTIEYWVITNYIVITIELLREKDKNKFNRYLEKHHMTMDKVIQGQKGVW